MSVINSNIQKTKETDLEIQSKEKKERKQDKYISYRLYSEHNITPSIRDIEKEARKISEFYWRNYLMLEVSTYNKKKTNNNNKNDNKNNQPKDSSKEDLYIKAKKCKKYKNLKIVNIDSFTILKTLEKLYYSLKVFYIILFLNIFLPGIGTIIAGIGWGKKYQYKDRTCELIIRGIYQFLTFFLIYGWILSIRDAIYYFPTAK